MCTIYSPQYHYTILRLLILSNFMSSFMLNKQQRKNKQAFSYNNKQSSIAKNTSFLLVYHLHTLLGPAILFLSEQLLRALQCSPPGVPKKLFGDRRDSTKYPLQISFQMLYQYYQEYNCLTGNMICVFRGHCNAGCESGQSYFADHFPFFATNTSLRNF